MVKISSLTLAVGVLGGALVGFLIAQVLPESLGLALESNDQTEQEEQAQIPGALRGLDYLTLGERHSGELTSSAEWNGKDGSRFVRYGLSLDEGELVELSLNGALWGAVTLYNDRLELLDSAENLHFRVDETGDYLVVVNGLHASSYGPFTLYPRVVELSDSDTLAVGEPLDRWLQGREQAVTLTVEEAGFYQIDMRSSDFDAYLTIEGPNGYQREDDDGGEELNAQVSDFLAPGDYTVRAQTYSGADTSGMYTLSAELRELDADSLRNDGPIEPDETLSGWYGAHPLEYTLEVEQAGIYQIDMTSNAIDAFLELHDDNGYYRENDDGGENLDARLIDFLAPGSYRIVARTPYDTGTSGLFTLSVENNELPEDIELQNGGVLNAGETINGWYSGDDVTYQLELDQSSAVSMTMNSTDFDAYLELNGEGVSYTDDDGGEGTNALLEVSLLPGSYTVHARGFNVYGSGLFELLYDAEPTEMPPDA